MLLRHVLIRFVFLAVFFNTVIGMPAHEAEHLQNVATAEAALPAPQASDDAAEHDQEADGACAWCLAYAHLGTALSSPPAALALPVNAGVPPPRAPLAFVPSAGHWPFASRDPPRPVA